MGKNKNYQTNKKPPPIPKGGNNRTGKKGGQTSMNREMFLRAPRSLNCLYRDARDLMEVKKIDHTDIRDFLAFECRTIEHQIIAIRSETQLTPKEYEQRCKFTERFLKCLSTHHKLNYEGLLFGSTINGLGLHDSDVDLRLRPLRMTKSGIYEPMNIDASLSSKILSDIAIHTSKCSPTTGIFVPSSRCPVAKLNFKIDPRRGPKEGLKYDISVASSNSLGSFNSLVLRFLCQLEPKFHLLATVLRYWTSIHKLVLPGLLSSYAVINMLIFFCQAIDNPLLPTIDQMRQLYLRHAPLKSSQETNKKALLQQEWNCLICLNKRYYKPSTNKQPLSVLLLKFFEFYLTFPYPTQIITTRPGKAITISEFGTSSQYHPNFPIKSYLNIQDPFDFKHNLTSGMDGGHFKTFMISVRTSYERLFKELTTNFRSPVLRLKFQEKVRLMSDRDPEQKESKTDIRDWGLNSIFVELTKAELKNE